MDGWEWMQGRIPSCPKAVVAARLAWKGPLPSPWSHGDAPTSERCSRPAGATQTPASTGTLARRMQQQQQQHSHQSQQRQQLRASIAAEAAATSSRSSTHRNDEVRHVAVSGDGFKPSDRLLVAHDVRQLRGGERRGVTGEGGAWDAGRWDAET